MLALAAGLSVQNEHFDAREPLYDDSNVNFRGNQVGEVRAGKPVRPYMGNKKLSKKQRKIKKNGR